MAKATKYVSKVADEQGNIVWSAAENKIWQALITRQLSTVHDTACDEVPRCDIYPFARRV